MNETLKLSVGANRQTAFTAAGVILILLSPLTGWIWPVTVIIGVIGVAMGLISLLRIPYDLVHVDKDILEAASTFEKMAKLAKKLDKKMDLLSGATGDVTDIIFEDWQELSKYEQGKMTYLMDGENDGVQWIPILRTKRRNAVRKMLIAARDISSFYERSRRVMGLSYDLYMVEEAETIPEPAEKPKPRRRVQATGTQEAIANAFQTFGLTLTPEGMPQKGPAITRYRYAVPQGVKLTKITNLSGDIALALGVQSVRIAPNGQSVVGVEVPNTTPQPVKFADLIKTTEWKNTKATLPLALGVGIAGKPIIADLVKMPHLLIAGTTGSGKSVCENGLICSLLNWYGPEKLKFLMVDPKMVELTPYNGLPHLVTPVVTDTAEAASALKLAASEMDERYRLFMNKGIKNIDKCPGLPYFVIIIDEMADLMMTAGKEVEESIVRIAQKGRAAGVHLILATQRPTKDVVTGLIKANVPSRIAFAVKSNMDSRIILDDSGAETLVGKGDMLYAPLDAREKIRVQGAYITDEEVEKAVRRWNKA